ncbi:MAG TPA: hypothetical protein PKL84_18075, partial [Candidatus Hydrogenedentes bacterium]|nr:hypothetical protein [Candidatus Hydrogenedentota bacterium]
MSETREEQAWLRTVSLIVLAAAAVTIGLYYTQPVMVPFVLALFLVVMVAPVLDGLIVRARAPRPVAVLATLLLVVAAIAMFCLIMIVAAFNMIGALTML